MAASNTDLLKKLSRRWVGQIGAGGVADNTTTTVPLSSSTNLATDTAVVVTIDRVDANGVATPSLEETVIGVVSGSNLVNCVRGSEGTAQAHNAGAVVEVLVTAKGWNDLVDGFLVQHNQLGLHTNITASNVTASGVLTATTVSSTRINPRVGTVADSATITPTGDTVDMYTVTALAQAATIAAPSGTPVNGQKLLLRLLDNGTARALTWNSIYVSRGATLPTTTTLSKYTYVGLIYNSTASKWDCVAVVTET